MHLDIRKGRYHARLAHRAEDVIACQRLRHRCFFGTAGLDVDRFDQTWQHLMVAETAGGPPLCTLRLRVTSGAAVLSGYSAQFYDLTSFAARAGSFMEIGRFCTDPAQLDPHILRVAWGALTQIVDAQGVKLIFGCTSFAGVDPAPFADVFHRLATRYAAPAHSGSFCAGRAHVLLAAPERITQPQFPMPPLLRTYLAMGGWVSDHAVIDSAMQTMHVLTALETAKVPARRASALRALA